MEKRAFGKTGMNISVLGFGGAEIGFNNISEKTVETLLNSALDAGLNIIDTAECYGTSEELIGKTISHRRHQFYLFSKVGHPNSWDKPDWSPISIEETIDRSLKRLKTDYLDLVQLHSCNEELLRKGDVIAALQKAKQAGKARFIGYSGDSTDALYAVNTGQFDTLQTSISIADQQAIDLTIPIAIKKEMGVIAKRPIANVAWRLGNKYVDEYSRPYWERLKNLQYNFINGNLKHSVDIALRFTLSIKGVHTAIVGTTKPERWQENAKLLAQGSLPEAEFDAIRKRWQKISAKDWVGQV